MEGEFFWVDVEAISDVAFGVVNIGGPVGEVLFLEPLTAIMLLLHQFYQCSHCFILAYYTLLKHYSTYQGEYYALVNEIFFKYNHLLNSRRVVSL